MLEREVLDLVFCSTQSSFELYSLQEKSFYKTNAIWMRSSCLNYSIMGNILIGCHLYTLIHSFLLLGFGIITTSSNVTECPGYSNISSLWIISGWWNMMIAILLKTFTDSNHQASNASHCGWTSHFLHSLGIIRDCNTNLQMANNTFLVISFNNHQISMVWWLILCDQWWYGLLGPYLCPCHSVLVVSTQFQAILA